MVTNARLAGLRDGYIQLAIGTHALLEDKVKTQTERKKALEDKKKKILEDREAAKLAKEKAKENKTN